jgi:hypothetical protein
MKQNRKNAKGDKYFCKGLYIDRCAFPNHVQSIELTTGGLQSSCNISRMISRMINGIRMHLRSNSSLKAKGLNTYANMLFLFFNTFENISRNLF